MGNNKIIGAKIKSIRESKQLSTQEVSERSGLSIEQIERIEGNIDFPSLAPLIKIARVLHKQHRFQQHRQQGTQTHGIPFAVTRQVGPPYGTVPDRCRSKRRRGGFRPLHTRRGRIHLCTGRYPRNQLWQEYLYPGRRRQHLLRFYRRPPCTCRCRQYGENPRSHLHPLLICSFYGHSITR